MSMVIDTLRFGKTEIAEESIIEFPEGILGFEENKRFAIIIHPATEPIQWLQSVTAPELSMPIINPFLLKPDYQVDVDDAELMTIGMPKEEDILVVNIMVVPEDIRESTVNLCAPVIVNLKNNKGRQIVMEYGEKGRDAIKFPAFLPLVAYYKSLEDNAAKECDADAGTDKKD